MSLGDFTVRDQSSMTGRGSNRYNVAAQATVINAGEPVARALGATSVTACATNAGQVGTDYIVGIAQTTSNQTSGASGVAGFVDVLPLNNGTIYIGSPTVAATWNTQAKYDALVGKRVLIDLTSSVYTVLASDSSGNGLVVMPLSVAKYPGKVAFAFRAALSDLA